MSANQSTIRSLFRFAIIFALVYLVTQMALKYFFPEQYGGQPPAKGILVRMQDDTVKGDHHPIALIQNATETDLTLEDRCPMPPFRVLTVEADGSAVEQTTDQTALPCLPLTLVAAGETATVDLAPWKYSLFGEFREYRLELPLPDTLDVPDPQAQFSIHEAGMPTQLFRTFVSKPLLNLLVFIASVLPSHDLGIAIIIVTLIVKLILFLPTQHAMEGQKKMQLVQPKMEALKAKYKDDPRKTQEETMKLWKEHKINPLQSCLPILIQFPILIGLFYTIRDGSVLVLSRHLLYQPYLNLSWTFDTNFLGMDLTQPNIIVMPILLMVLQFFQMKLSFALNKRKQDQEAKKTGPMSQTEIQQRVMLYGLPLMIGFFALQFPAAVSLYWGATTVFAILQQLYVNRRTS